MQTYFFSNPNDALDPHRNIADDDSTNLAGEVGPFELLMPPRSRYAGRPIDVSSRRSIEVKTSNKPELTINASESHVVVDYFYHEGRYWRALIPLNGVDQVFGQVFNFSRPRTRKGENGPELLFNKHGLPKRKIPILNHIQTRFRLKAEQPVELYPMGSEPTGGPVHRITDIIYSFEAVGPVGVAFNLRDAFAGNLVSAHRIMSIEEMVFERLVVEQQYITESPPLPLGDHERRSLLIESLLRSHQAGMAEPYYLFRIWGTNNCTSSPFHILDHVVNYQWRYWIGAKLYRLPLSPRLYLRMRGLDSDPTYRKHLRSEFETFISDVAVQERKRDHMREQTRIRRTARELQE